MSNKRLSMVFVIGLTLFGIGGAWAMEKAFTLSSPVFDNHGDIPIAYGRDEENISPPLAWSGEPQGTQSFILVIKDYDANKKPVTCLYDCVYHKPDNPKCPVVHWVVYNIPKTQHALDAGTKQFTQGMNTYHQKGYVGMNPPKGERHRYHFILYALNKPVVHIPASSNAYDLLYASRHNIMGKASLVGRYQKVKTDD